MQHSNELREAIKANNPVNITIKETSKTITVIAPNYSSHSAIFDKAFKLAQSLGINYRGKGHLIGEIYTVTFRTNN